MRIILALLMVVLGVVAVLLLKKRSFTGAGVCAVLVVMLAIGRLFTGSQPGEEAIEFIQRDRDIMTTVLAEKVAERHPGKRVGLLVPPAGLEGVFGISNINKETRDQLAAAIKQTDLSLEIINLPINQKVRQASEEDEPLEDLNLSLIMKLEIGVSGSQLNDLLRDQKGKVDVVICTMNINPDFLAGKLLAENEGPHLVLINPAGEGFKSALQSTVLDAVLLYHPEVSWQTDQKLPKDDAKAFDLRYVLATREDPSSLP